MNIQVQIRQPKQGDVSLDDCARFSEPMSEAIDSSKLVSESYVLEISSPGIEEHLVSDRDFQTFRGFPVEVTYLDSVNTEKNQTGLLLKRSADHVLLNIKGKMSRIPRDSVTSVRLTSPTG